MVSAGGKGGVRFLLRAEPARRTRGGIKYGPLGVRGGAGGLRGRIRALFTGAGGGSTPTFTTTESLSLPAGGELRGGGEGENIMRIKNNNKNPTFFVSPWCLRPGRSGRRQRVRRRGRVWRWGWCPARALGEPLSPGGDRPASHGAGDSTWRALGGAHSVSVSSTMAMAAGTWHSSDAQGWATLRWPTSRRRARRSVSCPARFGPHAVLPRKVGGSRAAEPASASNEHGDRCRRRGWRRPQGRRGEHRALRHCASRRQAGRAGAP